MHAHPGVAPLKLFGAPLRAYRCRVLLGGSSMSDQHSFVPADRFDRDQFTNSQAGERH